MDQCQIESSTFKKYARTTSNLADFTRNKGVEHTDEVNLETLDALRLYRGVCALTWSKELQLLRQFFSFCQKRKWVDRNTAFDMRRPRDPKPKERKPYTAEEITRILVACDRFGKGAYERLRAKAMVLLVRFYALRISDVATLERERVSNGRVYLHALKNGAAIWLPLYPEVKHALECLPLPRGAALDCRYFSGMASATGKVTSNCGREPPDRFPQERR
jgi:site-specific recombinase XerD